MTDGASEYFVLFHHKVLVTCAVEVRHRKPGTAQDKPKGRTLCRACPACYRARVAGPFVGGLGVLERLDGKGRVRLLLNIMGGQTPLMIDRADLAAA